MRIPITAAVGVGLSTIAFYSISAVSSPTAVAAAPPTEIDASTSASVLHLSTLDVPGAATLADAAIGIASGGVDGSGSPRTTASATNLDLAVADQVAPDLLAVANQKAPADHAKAASSTSVPGEIPDVASLDVSTATAHARWTGNQSCPAPGAPLTSSEVSTADVSTDPMSGVGTLLSLPGTASTSQRTTLDGAGQGLRKVVSTAQGSTADLRLLDGQLKVAVTDAPTLVATATGTPGGAKVSWQAPVVTVSLGGEEQTLPADGSPVDFSSPDNPLLTAELSLGQLGDVTEAGNGTKASGSASVLHVTVSLGAGQVAATVLDTDLFPLTASATAPEGGVDCGPGSHDTDGDGLTDSEETSGSANGDYGHTPTDPGAADTDGDGLEDGVEVSGSANDAFDQAPTDPNKPDTDGDSLGDGQETSGSANDGFGNEATDPTAADTDADGLGDGREVEQTATDPTNPDTDGGSVSDGDEVSKDTDPLDPSDDVTGGGGGGVDDPDNDGLDNQDELGAGTNPLVNDTDGDGVSDGDEVNQFETAPTDPDTDGDGLTDGREINETATKPQDSDTDDDGLSDGREVLQVKTDPLKKDTDRDGLTDGQEVLKYQTKPLKKDTDRDGLGDGKEVAGPAPRLYPSCTTDPTDADSDNDQLKDGRELKRTDTDPCDRDSDDGGVGDGKEVQAGSDPNDPHSTPKNPGGRGGVATRLFGPTG